MNRQATKENIYKKTLPSGIRILTEQIETVRSISVGIWVKTGSRHESEQDAGITHFLEHMLFKGTEKRSAFQISSSIEAAGGYLNAFTSSEYTCYYARCLDTELDTALDVLSDMVQHSVFPDEEIAKEKKVVIEEMKMYRDNPEDYVFEEFSSQIFTKHPLGRPIIGYESTVNGFKRDDLFRYMDDHYVPGNIIVTVTGNANPEKVEQLVREYLNKEPVDVKKIYGIEAPSGYKAVKKVLTRPIEQTHYIIGKTGLATDNPDRYKLLVIQTILSGGMSSRLHQNIREKYGYCYSIHAFLQSYKDTGMFGIYTGTDKNYLDHVKKLIFRELDKLKKKNISGRELEEVKTQLKGKLLLSQESMSNRMMRMAKSELYFDRYISLDELEREIDAVSIKDVRDFSNSFLNEEDFSETILMPEK